MIVSSIHKQKPEHGDEYWSEKLATLQASAEAKSAEAQELAIQVRAMSHRYSMLPLLT